MCFGTFGIDFAIELQVNMIGGLLGIRSAGKAEASRLKVELERLCGYVRNADREVDIILLSIVGRRALRPEDYRICQSPL
jgi:hypothetical protein